MQIHIRCERWGNHVTTQCGRYGPKVGCARKHAPGKDPEEMFGGETVEDICPHCLAIWRASIQGRKKYEAAVAEHHI